MKKVGNILELSATDLSATSTAVICALFDRVARGRWDPLLQLSV
jgi:hypothetical protein